MEPIDSLTESQWAVVEPVLDDFEKELQAGQQAKIEDYVARVDFSLREKLSEELVGLEFSYRFGDATQNGKPRYRPMAFLGEGAFGEVYKAHDEKMDRTIALKVLLPTENRAVRQPQPPSDRAKERFLAEARRQASLPSHDHLVPIYDFGTLPRGHPFAVLKYIDGGSLRVKLKSDGKPDPDTAARWMEQIALAVAAVHRSTSGSRAHPTIPTVHQDLKPENILLDSTGNAHVADFGIAAPVAELHSGNAGAGGTIPYLSPEQATAFRPGMTPAPIDTRSDVWALGVILYELLTGRGPFDVNEEDAKKRNEQILDRIRRDEPQRIRDLSPEVPSDLERLVAECLRKNVAERIDSAEKVAKRLRKWLDSIAVAPEPLDFSDRLRKAHEVFSDRPWLFDEVDCWAADSDQRLLLIVGEFASGKSSFVSELICRDESERQRVIAYHLCQHDATRSATRTAAAFVRSIAGMLAKKVTSYAQSLASTTVRDAIREERCAKDPARALDIGVITPLARATGPKDGVFFIVIDALDEADLETSVTIPDLVESWSKRLPAWLRIVATVRRGDPIERNRFLRAERLVIDHENAVHAQDLREDLIGLIRKRLKHPNLCEFLQHAGYSRDQFIELLLSKSECNFGYLSEALDGLKHGSYSLDELDRLPPGLPALYRGFFARHWPDRLRFEKTVRPILEILVAAEEPVPEGLLTTALGIDEYQLDESLDSLAHYLDRNGGTVSIRCRALCDWLQKESDIHRVVPMHGHTHLGQSCDHWFQLSEVAREYLARFAPVHLAQTHDWQRLRGLLTENVNFFELNACRLSEYVQNCRKVAEELPRDDGASILLNLADALEAWRWAIESGDVPPAQWWSHLAGVSGKIPELATDKRTRPLLVSPPRGYTGSSTLELDLSGEACVLSPGSSEYVVLASRDARLHLYRRSDGAFQRHCTLRVADGTNVTALEAIGDELAIAFTEYLNGKIGPTYLINAGQRTSQPLCTESEGVRTGAPVLPKDSCKILLSHESSGGSVLRVYRMRSNPLTGYTRESEGEELRVDFQVRRLWAFAPTIWAAHGKRGHEPGWTDVFKVYQLIIDGGARIEDITPSRFGEDLRGAQLEGACLLPENRLAVVATPSDFTTYSSETWLLVIGPSGALEQYMPLVDGTEDDVPEDDGPAELPSFGRAYDGSGDSAMDEMLEESDQDPAPAFLAATPLGYHAHFGLLLADPYRAIELAPEALARELDEAVLKRIDTNPVETRVKLRGAAPLAHGRVLFVFSNGATILGPGSTDAVDVVPIHNLQEPFISGVRADGKLVVSKGYFSDGEWVQRDQRYVDAAGEDKPVEPGFLRVCRSGAALSLDGSRIHMSTGEGQSRLVWDAGSIQQPRPGVHEEVEVLDATCNGEDDWAVAIGLHCFETNHPNEKNPGRYRELWLAAGRHPASFIERFRPNLKCTLEGFANSVLAFRVASNVSSPIPWEIIPLHLYDFSARCVEGSGNWVCRHFGRDPEHAHVGMYSPPLLDLSDQWLLVLGPPVSRWGTQHSVYQYRTGSGEPPCEVSEFLLTRSLSVLDRSNGRCDLLEIGPHKQWLRVHRLRVDREYGISLPDEPLETDLGAGVIDVKSLDGDTPLQAQPIRNTNRSRKLVVAYETGKIEIVAMPNSSQDRTKRVLAVGYVAEPPRKVAVCSPPSGPLAIATASGISWLELKGI